MSKTLTRKQHNRAVAREARKAGLYETVMARWAEVSTLRAEGVSPADTLVRMGLVAALDKSAPAKVTKARKATRKAAPKAAPRVAPPAPERPLTAERIARVFDGAEQFAIAMYMDLPDTGTCGGARVVVPADGRTRLGKALVEAGFEIRNGRAERPVLTGGAQAVYTAEKIAHAVADALRNLGLNADWSTWID